MKPGTLPEGAAWHEWPRLEVLQAESGISISKLRTRLASVPCYRCPDKSVRYEPAAARAALYDTDDDDDDDVIDAEQLQAKGGEFSLLAVMMREMMRMLAETRKERADTVRCMQGPLDTGLSLLREVMGVQAKRLDHLEGLWDRMVEVTEQMMAASHARDIERKKAEDTSSMRKHALGLLDRHGPMLMNKWTLTREAQLALQFLSSLDPKIVDVVAATGVLDSSQVEMLTQLRAAMAKRQQPTQQPPEREPDAEPLNHHDATTA